MLSLHRMYQLLFLSVHYCSVHKVSIDPTCLAPTPTCFERALLNPVTLMKLTPSVTDPVGVLSLQGSPSELLWLESVHGPGGRGRGPEN